MNPVAKYKKVASHQISVHPKAWSAFEAFHEYPRQLFNKEELLNYAFQISECTVLHVVESDKGYLCFSGFFALEIAHAARRKELNILIWQNLTSAEIEARAQIDIVQLLMSAPNIRLAARHLADLVRSLPQEGRTCLLGKSKFSISRFCEFSGLKRDKVAFTKHKPKDYTTTFDILGISKIDKRGDL